ncbi:choice-of-anchor B family protein [Aureisphaera galaxeae]|uniref:choice-of-anchor B family protein n=1 Tax=Aureisphaera galaxeae TaxID=1538023 RepID=UPI00300FFF43
MKNLLFLFAAVSIQCAVAQTPCTGGSAGAYPCNGYDLQSHINLSGLNAGSGNDSWGWTDDLDGKEYAIIALNNGTAFIDVSDPVNPVYLGKLPTHTTSSSWRDVKTYNNHAFVVSEAGGHGMQVFDLTRLRNVTNPPVTFSEDAHYNGFGDAHNIVINEDTGYAYPVGSSLFNGGPVFINIQDPQNPVGEGGYGMDDYSHDAQVVTYNGPDSDYTGREILIGSNENEVVIVDITDKSNPQNISSISYGNVGYTHQGWFTEDQRYFILGDETDELNFGFNTRTIVFDFEDLDNPQHHFDYTGPTAAIDHNGYVKGNKYYMANYRAGLRVIDLSNIASGSMTEEGFFDTYPPSNSASFDGAWSVYPYFGSGNIVISDINRGFFLVKAAGVDNTDPVAVCQDFTAQLGSNGDVIVAGSDVDGGSSDDSGSYTVTLSENSFDCSDLGDHVVTVTVTDPSGNTDTCTATITIEDTMAPSFTDCHLDETVVADEATSTYTLPDYVLNGDVAAADNCTSTLAITQDPVSGTEMAVGTHTISFETTDDEGNTNTCSFVLTVDEPLGVSESLLEQGLSIFPNPSSDQITVVSENQNINNIAIFDVTGKQLIDMSNMDVQRQNISISSLAEGIYFININNLITKRIVKK